MQVLCLCIAGQVEQDVEVATTSDESSSDEGTDYMSYHLVRSVLSHCELSETADSMPDHNAKRRRVSSAVRQPWNIAVTYICQVRGCPELPFISSNLKQLLSVCYPPAHPLI